MYTKFIDSNGIVFDVVTQQYSVGTYIIINSDPASQGVINIPEEKYHIKLRKKCIKNGGTLIGGNILNYKGDCNINVFTNVDENKENKK